MTIYVRSSRTDLPPPPIIYWRAAATASQKFSAPEQIKTLSHLSDFSSAHLRPGCFREIEREPVDIPLSLSLSLTE